MTTPRFLRYLLRGRSDRKPSSGRGGFALVFVLWGVTLLALMAAAFLEQSRVRTRATANIVAISRAEAIADAAVHQAIWTLLSGPAGGGAAMDGTPHSLVLDGLAVTISVQDEAGKLDLNGADHARLERLLLAVGEPQERASRLAANIIDFRDKDNLSLDGTAEAAAYPATAAGPANRPFRHLAELGDVAEIGRALEARLRAHLTVGPFARAVDPRVATGPALAAQPGISAKAAATYLAIRATDPAATPPEGPAYAVSPRNRFTIRARAEGDNGVRFTREALVLLDPSAPLGFRILSWR